MAVMTSSRSIEINEEFKGTKPKGGEKDELANWADGAWQQDYRHSGGVKTRN